MTVNRYDTISDTGLTTKAVVRDDGAITARSIITSIGVFPYKRADGSIVHELRETKAVFDEAFLESVKKMPIFVGHHMEADGTHIVDSVKIDALAVGYTGVNPAGDNVFLANDIEITRQDGRDAVNKGMRSFSVGYKCDVVAEAGVWCGVPYTHKQQNLRGVHLALVYAGRQGDQAVLRIDSEDAILVTDTTDLVVENKEDNKEAQIMAENLKVVKIDSVDYQAEAQVITALHNTQTKLDAAVQESADLKKNSSVAEAERDALKSRLDTAEAKVAELEKNRVDASLVDAMVADRLRVREAFAKAELEHKADMSDMDMKKAVVLNVFPNTKLDGKDDVYVNTSFDLAVAEQDARQVSKADASVREAGNSETVKVDGADTNSAEAARQRYINRLNKKKEA